MDEYTRHEEGSGSGSAAPEEEAHADGDAAEESGASAGGDEAGGGRKGRGPGGAWGGWTGLSDFGESVADLVDTALRNVSPAAGRFPRYDLIEVPHEGYRLALDLPGLRKSEVDVAAADGHVTVAGTRERPELPEGSEVHRSERSYGRFRRVIEVPGDVDIERITARMEDGVLMISLPRRASDDVHRIHVD